jgi:hypothetical protein
LLGLEQEATVNKKNIIAKLLINLKQFRMIFLFGDHYSLELSLY